MITILIEEEDVPGHGSRTCPFIRTPLPFFTGGYQQQPLMSGCILLLWFQVVDLRKKRIMYFDSMGGSSDEACRILL